MKINSIENQLYDAESFRKSMKSPKLVSTLCHYTNIPILLKILSTKKIKFNRIDFVNDLFEKKLLKENNNFKKVFVSCFTENCKEEIPMWKIYTKDALGVFIKLFFKDNISADMLFDKAQGCCSKNGMIPIKQRDIIIDNLSATLEFLNVEYKETLNNKATKKLKDENVYDYPYYFARYKTNYWSFEQEARYKITLNTGLEYNQNRHDYKELFLTINFGCLDKIEIVFNPWTSKNEWEDILAPFIKNINKDLFVLKDSELKNAIKF